MINKQLRTIVALVSLLPAFAASGCGIDESETQGEMSEEHTEAAKQPLTAAELLSPLIFDWGFYLANNPDLVPAGVDTQAEAEAHWINTGAAAGLQAHRGFHSKQYLEAYPDLQAYYGATNYLGAIEHFLAFGDSNNRLGAPFDRSVFNWQYYLAEYPGLVTAGIDTEAEAKAHWINYGVNEGRHAMWGFWPASYLQLYPDLKNAFGATNYKAAIRHFQRYGVKEGRIGRTGVPPLAQVGMFYLNWHGTAWSAQQYLPTGAPTLNLSDVVASRATASPKSVNDIFNVYGLMGHAVNFHYEQKPSLGYYSLYRKRAGAASYVFDGKALKDAPTSMTSSVARTHADQLSQAGVNFVFVDSTNVAQMSNFADAIALRPIEVLFEEWKAYRNTGASTPQIAVWTGARASTYNDPDPLWQRYLNLYNDANYSDLVLRDPYSGKKIMFIVASGDPNTTPDQIVIDQIESNGGRNDVLVMRTWAYGAQAAMTSGQHAWMESCRTSQGIPTTTIDPTQPCWQRFTPVVAGRPSSISVSASYQLEYASRFLGSSTYASGLTLKKQFETAFAIRPDMVLLNEWNEHLAQPQPNPYVATDNTAYSLGLYGDQVNAAVNGYYLWVDGFTSAYTRDMEPTVENGGEPYDILKSCLRVYRSSSATCSSTTERCCNIAESDEYVSIYSMRATGSGDHLLTKYETEKSTLVNAGTYREIATRGYGGSVFAYDPNEAETRSGPFILYSKNDATNSRIALYRCHTTIGGTHFFTIYSNCEGQAFEGLLGYMAASPSGTHLRPLRRCYDATNGWHMHSTAQDCPAGTSEVAVLGYVR